jgi:hypothetical protein
MIIHPHVYQTPHRVCHSCNKLPDVMGINPSLFMIWRTMLEASSSSRLVWAPALCSFCLDRLKVALLIADAPVPDAPFPHPSNPIH